MPFKSLKELRREKFSETTAEEKFHNAYQRARTRLSDGEIWKILVFENRKMYQRNYRSDVKNMKKLCNAFSNLAEHQRELWLSKHLPQETLNKTSTTNFKLKPMEVSNKERRRTSFEKVFLRSGQKLSEGQILGILKSEEIKIQTGMKMKLEGDKNWLLKTVFWQLETEDRKKALEIAEIRALEF